MNIPPDIYANITRKKEIKKITTEDANPKQEPTQGEVIVDGPVNGDEVKGRVVTQDEFMG